jgi:hypothetical protein
MVTKILDFLNKNWFFVLILFVLIYMVVKMQITNNNYKEQAKIYKKEIKHLELEQQISLKLIDSLRKMDTVYITEIETIKGESYETIKIVDTMSVSSMQEFFANRYSKEE